MSRPLVRRSDASALAGVSIVLASPFVAHALGAPPSVTVVAALSSAGCVALGLLTAVRTIERGLARTRNSVQASCELASFLAPYAPLPPMDGWAAHPELAAACVRIVSLRRPACVVELGSGVSTVLLAMALERVGSGRLISLDHDARYAAQTRAVLEARGLSGRVEVRHAPLVRVQGSDEVLTYDLSVLDDDAIDVLVVDGPPNGDGRGARACALEQLASRLAPRAVVVVDDAHRADERRMVAEFVARTDGAFRTTRIDSEKGVVLLARDVPEV